MVDAQNTHNIDGRLLDERIHDNIHSISSLAARAPHMIHGIHTSSRTQVVVKDRPSPTGRSLSRSVSRVHTSRDVHRLLATVVRPCASYMLGAREGGRCLTDGRIDPRPHTLGVCLSVACVCGREGVVVGGCVVDLRGSCGFVREGAVRTRV